MGYIQRDNVCSHVGQQVGVGRPLAEGIDVKDGGVEMADRCGSRKQQGPVHTGVRVEVRL